ncbi:MAG: c-type cytochrome [Candidatus Methylomirabilales bacterium]
MKRTTFFVGVALVIGALSGCTAETERREMARMAQAPVEYKRGEGLFNSYCSKCHGKGGRGTDQGPPFLHRIYHPDHHGDESFHLAAQRGAIAHHWQFGNMPKVEGLNEGDVNEIAAYVRWLQRQAGIY